jgi:hypothetical protein
MKKTVETEQKITHQLVKKMDFEGAEAVHDALCFAFFPEGLEDNEEIDAKFMSLWCLFLVSAGWEEDEFWEAYNSQCDHCKDCGASLDNEGRHEEEELALPPTTKQVSAANKPN